jgi:hypothetical protein
MLTCGVFLHEKFFRCLHNCSPENPQRRWSRSLEGFETITLKLFLKPIYAPALPS